MTRLCWLKLGWCCVINWILVSVTVLDFSCYYENEVIEVKLHVLINNIALILSFSPTFGAPWKPKSFQKTHHFKDSVFKFSKSTILPKLVNFAMICHPDLDSYLKFHYIYKWQSRKSFSLPNAFGCEQLSKINCLFSTLTGLLDNKSNSAAQHKTKVYPPNSLVGHHPARKRRSWGWSVFSWPSQRLNVTHPALTHLGRSVS